MPGRLRPSRPVAGLGSSVRCQLSPSEERRHLAWPGPCRGRSGPGHRRRRVFLLSFGRKRPLVRHDAGQGEVRLERQRGSGLCPSLRIPLAGPAATADSTESSRPAPCVRLRRTRVRLRLTPVRGPRISGTLHRLASTSVCLGGGRGALCAEVKRSMRWCETTRGCRRYTPRRSSLEP